MINETVQLSTLLIIPTVKIVHYVVSVSFLVFAVLLVYRSVSGIRQKRKFSTFDKFLSYAFIINLYLQLIFGIILFTGLGTDAGLNYMGIEEGAEKVSKRLWPVEHIVLMLFALFIANLGLISSLKTQDSKGRYRKVLIYYLLSIFLIAFSLISIYV
ncbi:hypothetical protein INQ51_15030 [Maribellus sp. CM-23]|uniref:hypothetical protein n=1 Tax=Maribellus sp. CM-23 TaxID=2781026 RepID=UPI001F1990EE|nr:hypothetical protein [Maribellus sp. CM-23]MCE4565631.1 hypothetical protein [Maribellus sp. CM-23]